MTVPDLTLEFWRDRAHAIHGALVRATHDLGEDLQLADAAVEQADMDYAALLDLMDSTDMTIGTNPDWVALRAMLVRADRLRSVRQERQRIIRDRRDAAAAALATVEGQIKDAFAFARVAEAGGTS